MSSYFFLCTGDRRKARNRARGRAKCVRTKWCAIQKPATTTEMAKGNFYIKMLIEVVKKTNKRKGTYKKRWVDKYSCWLHEKWPANEKSKQIWITRYAIYLFIYLSSFANFQAVCSKRNSRAKQRCAVTVLAENKRNCARSLVHTFTPAGFGLLSKSTAYFRPRSVSLHRTRSIFN